MTFAKPISCAGCVAQRRDDDVRPEARAVLADAPALVLEASVLRRLAQLELREMLGDVFGRVEDREVLADDLVGAVALDALGAGVPAQDVCRSGRA